MSPRTNHTPINRYTPIIRTDQRDPGCVVDFAGSTNGGIDAEKKFIGARDFDLVFAPRRTQNTNTFDISLRTNQCDLFVGCKLSRLGQRFQFGQFVARAKQRFDGFLC